MLNPKRGIIIPNDIEPLIRSEAVNARVTTTELTRARLAAAANVELAAWLGEEDSFENDRTTQWREHTEHRHATCQVARREFHRAIDAKGRHTHGPTSL